MKVRTDWLQILDGNSSSFFKIQESGQQHLHAQLDPLLREYLSPLNGFFCASVRDLKELEQRPLWLCRDGILPLLFFFNKFKSPQKLKSKILIHEDLLNYVPSTWRSKVGSFRMLSLEKKSRLKSVFIYGFNSETMVSSESAVLSLNRVPKGADVLLYLPNRRFSGKESEHEPTRVAYTVFKKVGDRVRIVDWAEVLPIHDWKSCELITLQKKTVVSDDWLFHAMVSKGAYFQSQAKKPGEDFVHFSPHHGCAFNLKPKWPSIRSSEYDGLLRTEMNRIEMSAFDWFSIFGQK